MASTLSPSIRAEVSEDRWSTEQLRPVDLATRPSLGKRASRAFARLLITFCIGVSATLAWQSYGDAARQMIANSYPQLGWLAPQAAPLGQTPANMAAPAALSPELLQLKAMAANLAAVRQSVDQLAAQLAAGRQQTAGDIANLQAVVAAGQQQMAGDIAKIISAPPPRPAASPARKPMPLTPPPPPSPSSEAPPAR
jgi:hypothetical protein